jgi:Protein of unknown function (DUF2911)
MKSLLMSMGALVAFAGLVSAQSPATTETKAVSGKTITIKYSAPKVNGRAGKIFTKDGLIGRDKTYPVWRAGANSATTLTTDGDLDIGGLAVPKGTYTLFVDISDPENWQLVVNKQTGQWGLSYDKAQDLGRVKMTMTKPAATLESLKYTITDAGGNKGKLELAWEDRVGSVAFTVK